MNFPIHWRIALLTGIVGIVFGFGIGYALPKEKKAEALEPLQEVKMPANQPLFHPEVCRQSADFLFGILPQAPTPAERNLCAIAAATLREAELFALFERHLAALSPEMRQAAVADERTWQNFYQERMLQPLALEGKAGAALENSLRSGALLFDRILYWAGSDEDRSSFNAFKEAEFSDQFNDGTPVKLHFGLSEVRGVRYQLLPGLAAGTPECGGMVIYSAQGNRQLVCFRRGKRVKSIRFPDKFEIMRLAISPEQTQISVFYQLGGKAATKPMSIKF